MSSSNLTSPVWRTVQGHVTSLLWVRLWERVMDPCRGRLANAGLGFPRVTRPATGPLADVSRRLQDPVLAASAGGRVPQRRAKKAEKR